MLEPAALTALKSLRQDLPPLMQLLATVTSDDLEQWVHSVDIKLLPRIQPDFPLAAAICGGGSAGKSTLFNTLFGRPVSPTGGHAGINRRILAGLPARHADHNDFLDAIFQVFGQRPEPLATPGELQTPGPPRMAFSPDLPANVVLLDTPDFDTGAGGRYTNRNLSRQALESADVLVYIFTNATYNNRDNTDFIARMLTRVGMRKCFLVYRVYPSFDDSEVADHARTVARHIYGAGFADHVLGIYRADEDNRVAAGESAMRLRPVPDDGPSFETALAAIDPRRLRGDLIRSIHADVMDQARSMTDRAGHAMDQLARYLNLLHSAQRRCVQLAMAHFPIDHVMTRFAAIWLAGDPAHIKWMRRTGKLIEWPLTALVHVTRRLQGKKSVPITEKDTDGQVEIDLLEAANRLIRYVLDDPLSVRHQPVPPASDTMPVQQTAAEIPSLLKHEQNQLRHRDWTAALHQVSEHRQHLMIMSEDLEAQLARLAREIRRDMGTWGQVRQTFSAALNVLPATAAITYILHTGDPVGAAGIKVKLTGLLGIKDLYALIAIPATAGMKNADRQQLQAMLAPVARTWLEHKLRQIDQLFTDQITGPLFNRGQTVTDTAAGLINRVRTELSASQPTKER